MVENGKPRKPLWQSGAPGQALMEYALILVLVAIALAAALIATGPALGNVFSNTVYNLIGENGTPQPDLANRGGGGTSFWQTITAVATNPPRDRSVPTNPPAPPPPTNTPGPSPTPTDITPTITPSFTPTVTISPTPQDIGHNVPFVDPIDHPEWWRVDSSVWLGGDDWRGEYYPNRNLTPPADTVLYNGEIDIDTRFNINFNWGNGSPIAGWLSDNFSIRFTRKVYVYGASALTLNFNVQSDEGVRLCIDAPAPTRSCASSPKLIDQWNTHTFNDPAMNATTSLSPGEHYITLEYYEASGPAGVIMDIASYKGNVAADQALPSGPANCQWARVTGSQPNTVAWAWQQSAIPGNGFPPNMRCNLELRGWIDLIGLTTPELTFWEVWDFSASANSKIQIAEYVPYNADGTGGPNWAAGTTVTLRSGGKNYNWIKNTVPIPASLIGKKITYRIVLESAAGTGIRRYYIDDIEINNPNLRNFTVWCGNPANCPDGVNYNLDTGGQTDNFIASGRWALTATNTAENSPLSWNAGTDNGKYVRFGPEQGSGDLRIHSIEFKGNISLPFNADGTGGMADFEGDDGFPQLTFFQAWDLDQGESLELQWTRDPRDAVVDNWQTLTSFVSTGGSTSSQTMKQISVPLNTIPTWNTAPFRLRFAFKVDNNYDSRSGWFIDSIILERKGRPKFGSYPFCETAENGHNQWLFSGQWGEAVGGAFGSARSFTDSPAGNYILGQETAMEQKFVTDFANDSPENFVAPNNGNRDCFGSPSGAATRPILTFWHHRSIGSNHTIAVDLYRPSAPGTTLINWTPIWTYSYVNGTNIQDAWERVVIDLQPSIEALNANTPWATLSTNPNKYDDDFMFRIRLDTRSGSGQRDGVYVDNVEVSNYVERAHKLWDQSKTVAMPATEPPAGAGNGDLYYDDIDNPAEWWERWWTGGDWTAVDWDQHSGAVSMHDHPNGATSYADKQYSILELNAIFDLRGTLRSDQPTLYFWNHYSVGDGDTLSVQVSIEDRTRTTQTYDYVRGWGSSTSYGSPNFSSWQPLAGAGVGSNRLVNTWKREQVNLSTFADDPATPATNEGKRIKIRFVLNTYSVSSNLGEGWWIDDVAVRFREPRIIGLPFFDGAQNTSNWIAEGIWGLAPDKWRGSGGGPAALGTDPYHAYYFDCIRWGTNYTPPAPVPQTGGATDFNQTTCTDGNTTTFFNSVPRELSKTGPNNDIAEWIAARPTYPKLTGTDTTIDYDLGTTGRPPGAPAGGAGATWDDNYMGRYYRRITVLAGDYTFITTSDNTVNLIYRSGTGPWQTIINNWVSHGRTVNFGTVTLGAGSYDLILEWYEGTGSATMILQVGNNNYSFTDSPKASASPAVPAVNSVQYGDSSLILDGLLNLNNPGVPAATWIPRLQYYTYYTLRANGIAEAQITIDGGFSWTNANLGNNCPAIPGIRCNPVIQNNNDVTWLEANGDWELRSHDLRNYINRNIGLRFHLITTGNVRDGWWITDILVTN